MEEILTALDALKDEAYADFQAKLTPGIPRDRFIGVRIPMLRKYARSLAKQPEHEAFLAELPHKYYDENLLHGMLISEMKDYQTCVKAMNTFLPYVDNWAVCDTMSPKVFKKHHDTLIDQVHEWILSEDTYTCRFGMKTLMAEYLDLDFREEYLAWPAAVISDAYYVNMMIAWYFATALAKQWEAALPYITEQRLPVWVHNKTIQKAVESYRITPEQKALLKTYRIRKSMK